MFLRDSGRMVHLCFNLPPRLLSDRWRWAPSVRIFTMVSCERPHLSPRPTSIDEPRCLSGRLPAESHADIGMRASSAGSLSEASHAFRPTSGLAVPHQVMHRSPPPQTPDTVPGVMTLSTQIEHCKQRLQGILSGSVPIPQDLYDGVYEADFSGSIWNFASCGLDWCMAYFGNREPCPGRNLMYCGGFLLWPVVMLPMFLPAQLVCRLSKSTCPTTAHKVLSYCSGLSFGSDSITEESKARLCRDTLTDWSYSVYPGSGAGGGYGRHPGVAGLLFDSSMHPTERGKWVYRVRPEVLDDLAPYAAKMNSFYTWCRENDIPYYKHIVGEATANLGRGLRYVGLSDRGDGAPVIFSLD